jgi:hypothetical protein
MKPTEAQIFDAAESFEALKFFPAGSTAAKRVVMELLDGMVATEAQLKWLMDAQINRVGEWHGPAQLRALFNTQFRSADGIEGEACEVAGFTPADCERDYFERQSAETNRMLAAAKREQKLLGPAEPLNIAAAVKPIEAPKRSRTEQDVREQETRERLASVSGMAAARKPLYVPATPKRTPAETADAIRETERQLQARRLAREGAQAQPEASPNPKEAA